MKPVLLTSAPLALLLLGACDNSDETASAPESATDASAENASNASAAVGNAGNTAGNTAGNVAGNAADQSVEGGHSNTVSQGNATPRSSRNANEGAASKLQRMDPAQ
ncbi:MAG: hypothetical protein ABJP48_12910 [Erythrobacter sp.]